MNRALLFLISLAALVLFGSTTAAADCAEDEQAATTANSAADINGDGCVGGQADDDAMQAAMASGDPAGDLNGSGSVNVTDWNLFVNAKNS